VPWSGSQARCGRRVLLYWARAEERRGVKREYRLHTILEFLQCGGGSNITQYMPLHPELEAFGGNLTIAGTGASTGHESTPNNVGCEPLLRIIC